MEFFSLNTELKVITMTTAFNLKYLRLNYLFKSLTCPATFNRLESQSDDNKYTASVPCMVKFILVTSLWKSVNNKIIDTPPC